MTMLDGMRRNKGWLKWSLGLVILAFIFLYAPGFVDETALPGMPNEILAKVGEHEITVSQFRQIFLAQLQQYQLQGSSEVTEELLRSLGIDRQILQVMINRHAAISEAERLGLQVSAPEIRERIISLPSFQENGQFIGEQRYRQMLQFQSPPITTAEFENDIRSDILIERLQTVVTDWISISDEEIAEEYRLRNEKIKVELVTFLGNDYQNEVEPTDDDIQSFYTEMPFKYQIPEKRKLQFLLVDQQAISDNLTLTDDETESYYSANIDQYSTPGQLRASHILLRTEGSEDADVQARAMELITQAREGADFAELARQHSDDEGTADRGGDLGLFGRGAMVQEFETAAFSLDVDTISEPVKSPFGYHIIKVIEKQNETIEPIDEVRESIETTIKQERASSRANSIAQAIMTEVSLPQDLEQAASSRGFELQESTFVTQGEPILGLGLASELSAEAFQLEIGEVTGPVDTPMGPAFVTVVERQDPLIPPLEDVREEVNKDVIEQQALTLASKRAAEFVSEFKKSDDFSAAARTFRTIVKQSELMTRGSAFPEIGINRTLERVAFELPVGSVSDVIETDTLATIVHIMERQDVTTEQIDTAKESLKAELQQNKKNQFYETYMAKVQEQLLINVDETALEAAIGTT